MRMTLATKILITIVGVLALALLSSIVTIGLAFRFEAFQQTLVAENLESMRAAEELEIALLEQRGYASLYILDNGNPVWLTQLDQHREHFDDWLATARGTARSDRERELLDELEVVQRAYATKREEVIELYQAGQVEQAKQVLLRDVSTLYLRAFEVCEEFIASNQILVDTTSATVRREVQEITVVAMVTLVVTFGLALVLLWLFFGGVVVPLRRMANEMRSLTGNGHHLAGEARADELRDVGHYLQVLMTDVAETRSDLERSRRQLAHAEKLAAVGKLAASVAHEIRNPLTAIKMWLYSLRRAISQDTEAQQKLSIITDEIARLEHVVRSFLEFGRPPELKIRPQSIVQLLNTIVELVSHQLVGQRITIVLDEAPGLPEVMADTEQLSQVFLNLINNAVDAMPDGGELQLKCARSRHGGREMVAVRVADNGVGMVEAVQQRIFEPFFTTKEEGTGLGLCIAASIMARHRGTLELESSGRHGTVWTVRLPTFDRL